jgi:hypothetical protein
MRLMMAASGPLSQHSGLAVVDLSGLNEKWDTFVSQLQVRLLLSWLSHLGVHFAQVTAVLTGTAWTVGQFDEAPLM